MRGSADFSAGGMQTVARAEQSGAEQADCWSQWPSKTTAGGQKSSAGGGERDMTIFLSLPCCLSSCLIFNPEEVDGTVELVIMGVQLVLAFTFYDAFLKLIFCCFQFPQIFFREVAFLLYYSSLSVWQSNEEHSGGGGGVQLSLVSSLCLTSSVCFHINSNTTQVAVCLSHLFSGPE